MNAALRKYDPTEGSHMPANEKVDFDLAVQVVELRSDVRHIQSDTTDIKAELRATNQRLDSLSQKTDERFERLEQKMDGRLERLEQKFDRRFETNNANIDERFDKVDKRFQKLEESLASAKVWALGLYIALAGSLFYVLAHGFKWL
jgi:chromosome segregation ATPase